MKHKVRLACLNKIGNLVHSSYYLAIIEIYYFNAKVQKFIESADKPLRPRIARMLELLAKHGNLLGMPYSKALGGGLFELRIVGILHVRIIYAFHYSSIWILHGFTKKTAQMTKHDIEYAREQLKRLADL